MMGWLSVPSDPIVSFAKGDPIALVIGGETRRFVVADVDLPDSEADHLVTTLHLSPAETSDGPRR